MVEDNYDPFDVGAYDPFAPKADGFAPSRPERTSPEKTSDPFEPKATKPSQGEDDPFAPLTIQPYTRQPEGQPTRPQPTEQAPPPELPEVEDKSLWDEFTTGLGRGIDTTQALGYGLGALIGDATGWDWLRDKGAEGYARNMQEAGENAASVRFTEIDDAGDVLQWAAGGIGELLPTFASMIAGGGVGGLAARAALPAIGQAAAKKFAGRALLREMEKQVVKETAEKGFKTLGKEALKEAAENRFKGLGKESLDTALKTVFTNLGATTGAFLTNTGLNTGEVYGNFIDPQTGEIVDSASRAGRVFGSIGGGLLAGALDTAVPLAVWKRAGKVIGGRTGAVPEKKEMIQLTLDKLKSPSNRMAKAAANLLATSGLEGTTEAAQELISEVVGVTVDEAREWDWSEFKPQAIEAFALGALGGGVMGSPVAVAETLEPTNQISILERQLGMANLLEPVAQEELSLKKLQKLSEKGNEYRNREGEQQGNVARSREEIVQELRSRAESEGTEDTVAKTVENAAQESEILDSILGLDPKSDESVSLSNDDKFSRLSTEQQSEFETRLSESLNLPPPPQEKGQAQTTTEPTLSLIHI